MREIKFRAFDKELKKWIYLQIHPTQIEWASPSYTMQKPLRDAYQDLTGVSFGSIEGWLEFTGLKDKNGKEIYEGDVLRDTLCEGISNNNILVIFREDLSSFALSKNGWMHDHFFKEGVEANETEIIGNLYENPELLKSEGIVK